MSGVEIFLDANVFICLVDGREPTKQAIARAFVGEALADGSALISWQVVQETMHVLGHKFKVAITRADRNDLLREVLAPLWKVQPSPALVTAALDIHERQGFGFYGSLIVAAAAHAGCKRLLTEDLQHGQRVGRLRIENPFIGS